MTDDLYRKRLYWHSRRGMLELDLILVPFLEECFGGLTEQERQRYEYLLTQEDQDLFRWFLGREVPDDPELAAIVAQILIHARTPRS